MLRAEWQLGQCQRWTEEERLKSVDGETLYSTKLLQTKLSLNTDILEWGYYMGVSP